MTPLEWLSWGLLAVGLIGTWCALHSYNREHEELRAQIDELQGEIGDVRGDLATVTDYAKQIGAYLTDLADEQPTGRHAHTGEMAAQ